MGGLNVEKWCVLKSILCGLNKIPSEVNLGLFCAFSKYEKTIGSLAT